MDTGKQINAMVIIVIVAVAAFIVYAVWDPVRSQSAEDDQRLLAAERGATTFAQNCRLCHGDRGQGSTAGGRLAASLPLDTDTNKGIENGVFSQDLLDQRYDLIVNTITCGRVDRQMQPWAESQGGTLSDEQIRQLAVLITGAPAEGFWDLAQEHADQIDAETTANAVVQQPDGVFDVGETELVVSNAAPFTPGQYIRIRLEGDQPVAANGQTEERLRILPKQLEVQRGMDGTEAVEHSKGTPILRAQPQAGEAPETGEALTEAVGAEDAALVVDDTSGFTVGETLLLGEERVSVTNIATGIPTTGQQLAEEMGRTPTSFLVSRPGNIAAGAVIRLDGELVRVEAVSNSGDTGIRLDGELAASSETVSVSDPTFFRPDYVMRIGDEMLRVVEAVETGQMLGEVVGRAETSFEVSGIDGLSADMTIRVGGELMRVIAVEPARIKVQRGAPDELGNATRAAVHRAGSGILLTDAQAQAGDGEAVVLATGVTLVEQVTDVTSTLTTNGTAGIVEGQTYRIGTELVRVLDIEFARLRVERAVGGTETAEHARRSTIFDGNLLEVERGFENTSAAPHQGGETVFLTELQVERAAEGSELQEHSKGAEIFLGNALIVQRGIKETTPAAHRNGALVLDFPPPLDDPPILQQSCGQIAPARAPTPTPGGATPTPGGPTTGPGQSVAVSMIDFAFELDTTSAADGDFSFDLANEGSVPHNFRVAATDLAVDALPTSGGVVQEDRVDVLQVLATSSDVNVGATETVTVNLPPGNYVLFCNIPSHYEAGMRTAFEVTEP